MTTKDTEEAIKVMQAWVDGKTIQSKEGTSTFWRTLGSNSFPTWDWSKCEYRIKPKPAEIEIWFNPRGERMGIVAPNDDAAARKKLQWTKKKFREVIE